MPRGQGTIPEDVAGVPHLAEALVDRGVDDQMLRRIASENFSELLESMEV